MAEATDQTRQATPQRLPPYPSYKDSDVEWLGEIPAHWDVDRLKYLVTLNDEILAESTDPELEINYVDIGSVDTINGITEIESIVFENAPSRARRVVRSGDVIISMVRTYLRAITTIGAEPYNLIVSTGFAVLRPRRLDGAFASYVLRAPYFVERVVANSVGVSYPAINASILTCFSIAHPCVQEQRAIAAFLDRETARIDALVARKERLIELLQEKRTALVTRAVTRGLDPSVPMVDSGTECLGEVPSHWNVKRLRHMVSHIEQGWSPECENREASENEWGVLKAGCVNRGTFVESEHKALPATLSPIAALEIREGDLLMSRASGSEELVGSVALVPDCRARLLLCDKVFRLHTESMPRYREFISYAMNSRPVRWQIESVLSGGKGLASNISQEAVKDLVVAQPPVDQMQAIVEYIDHHTTRIDALLVRIGQAIDHLDELRTALISAAVTGKIDVRNESP